MTTHPTRTRPRSARRFKDSPSGSSSWEISGCASFDPSHYRPDRGLRDTGAESKLLRALDRSPKRNSNRHRPTRISLSACIPFVVRIRSAMPDVQHGFVLRKRARRLSCRPASLTPACSLSRTIMHADVSESRPSVYKTAPHTAFAPTGPSKWRDAVGPKQTVALSRTSRRNARECVLARRSRKVIRWAASHGPKYLAAS